MKKDQLSIEIYEKMKIDLLKEKGESNLLDLILIGIFFPLTVIIHDFINSQNNPVGFWALEIFYICIFSYFIFKIYIHKRIAIYIMFGVSIITFIEFFLPRTKTEDPEKKNDLTDKNVFDKITIKFGTYAIFLFILANEVLHILRDFCWVKGKYLMDIKSFSPAKIFMTIGCFGFIFVIILFSIFTYVPCKSFNHIEKKGDLYINLDTNKTLELYKECCQLKDYDENTKALFLLYDSMKLISREYSNTEKENMLEIFLIIPLLFIFLLINEISLIMMVKYTDANNILIYRNIYYFIKRIIVIIINKGDEKYLKYLNFFLIEFEELVSILSNLIYIEVLELRFCRLNYELKKNITMRGSKDFDAVNESLDQTQIFEIENKTDESEGSDDGNDENNVMIEM